MPALLLLPAALPPGVTVSDALICWGGSPAWQVTMANSGPNPTIDYTLQADGGTKVDYDVTVGPPIQRLVDAQSGSSHLTVLADGVKVVDNTQSIECGDAVTTSTTLPHATTSTTVRAAGQPAASSTTIAPSALDPATHAANTLPFTGSSSLPLSLFGSALVAAGAVAVMRNRRRTR